MTVVSNDTCKIKAQSVFETFNDLLVVMFNFDAVDDTVVHQIATYYGSPVLPNVLAQSTNGRWSAFYSLLCNIDADITEQNNMKDIIETFEETDPTDLVTINMYLIKYYHFYILYDDGRAMVLKKCSK